LGGSSTLVFFKTLPNTTQVSCPNFTPLNPQTHPIETTKFVKEKAFETAILAKEPLTSHAHHVKMQNRYNTNLYVYSNFGFSFTTE